MLRFLCLLLLILGATFPASAEEDNPFTQTVGESHDQASREFSRYDVDKFRVLEEIKTRMPFANLPFLKVRDGEKLVRAQDFSTPSFVGKGSHKDAKHPEGFWRNSGIWIVRDGRVRVKKAVNNALIEPTNSTATTPVEYVDRIEAVEIYVDEENGHINLSDIHATAYFDWDPTLANANALYRFCCGNYRSVSLDQLEKIDEQMQVDYAEYESERISLFTKDNRGFISGFQEKKGQDASADFIYSGIVFDSGIYHYIWRLSSYGWREERASLVRQPLPQTYPGMAQQSLPLNYGSTLSEDVRRRLDAQDARYKKWREIIDNVLGVTN